MKNLILIIALTLGLTGCATSPKVGKTIEEMAQRFGGKKYSIEPVKGEDDQYIIRIFNSNVQKRRLNRQKAMSEICPYSKRPEILAEKDDHKQGKTQLVVWCRSK